MDRKKIVKIVVDCSVVVALFSFGLSLALPKMLTLKTNKPTDPVVLARDFGEVSSGMLSINVLKAYADHQWLTNRANQKKGGRGQYTPEGYDYTLVKEGQCKEMAEYVFSYDPDGALEEYAFQHCPTQSMVKYAFNGKCSAFDRFSPNFWTPALVLQVLQDSDTQNQSRRCFWTIPSSAIDKAVLRVLIQKDLLSSWHGGLADSKYWDSGLAQEAFAQNKKNYEQIPDIFKTYEMSLAAVRADGMLLRNVPREQKLMRGGELCRIALQQADQASSFVPEVFKYKFQ